jgi:hypothetical protein
MRNILVGCLIIGCLILGFLGCGEIREPFLDESEKTIFLAEKNSINPATGDYEVNALATDLMNGNPRQAIDWMNVYVLGNPEKKRLRLKSKATDLVLFSDACNTNGLLNSAYKEDMCTSTDPLVIDAKCQGLSPANCSLSNCCVLVPGDQCVGGNAMGPNFDKQDLSYYYHKETCYGDCVN